MEAEKIGYKVDLDGLHDVTARVVGTPLEHGELITRATDLLTAKYPDVISAEGRWVGNKAGGILGKVRFLYFTPREHVVIFGPRSGTQGFSGRDKRVEVRKYLSRRSDRLLRP